MSIRWCRRTGVVACVAGLIVLLGGCAAGGRGTSANPPASAQPGGWAWPADDETSVDATPSVSPATGTPSGVSLGSIDVTGTSSASTTGQPNLDPCGLVTAAEWSSWSGAAGATPISLEYGQVCGWKNADDTVRMAIGAFSVDGDQHWLTGQQAPGGQSVSGLGDRATWLTDWPLSQASTLVVETATWDVVIEMDSRGGMSFADLQAGATRFARTALPRLPAESP